MKFNDIVRLITQKFIASIISLKVLIVIIIFLSLVIILEVVSNIPIIGDNITDSVREQIQNMSSMNVLDENKIPYYIELEKDSYLKEIKAQKTIEISSYSLSSTSEIKAFDYIISPSQKKEVITIDITDKTRKYRLWWQSIAAFDIISLGGDAKTFKVADQVATSLSPIYNYNFDLTSNINATNITLNDYSYHKEVETIEYYVDGELQNTKIKQTNSKETIPYPCLNFVSTMFFDYTFSYELKEINKKTDSKSSVSTGIKYIADSEGLYVYDNLLYVYRLAAENDSGTRYKKASTKTITTINTENRYYSYSINETSTKNDRYMEYFSSHTKENGFNYKQEEPLEIVLMGEHISDAYEFVNEGTRYFDRAPNYRIISSGAYTGTKKGNYDIRNEDTGYMVPIKFADTEDVVYTVKITSPYGPRSYGDGFHDGVDFGIPVGTPIIASQSGEITEYGYNSVRGNYIEIKHLNGTYTRYWHNSSLIIPKDLIVNQGDVIAISGNTGESTGPHLHFEYRDINHNLLDPMLILPLIKSE